MREAEKEGLAGYSAHAAGSAGHTEDTPLPDDEPGDFDAEDKDGEVSIDRVVDLGGREQCAARLACRRAIERRMEQKALDHDLDDLACDLDD